MDPHRVQTLTTIIHILLLSGMLVSVTGQVNRFNSEMTDFTCVGLETLDSMDKFTCQESALNAVPRVYNCSGVNMPFFPKMSMVPAGSEALDFSNNRLDCLPQINETVEGCQPKHCHRGCLQDLRLQDNEIEHLHRGAFTNLTCLQSLNLAHNQITNVTLARFRPFDRLVSLKRLDLHGNPLKSLPDNILVETYLPHLRYLDLSRCDLEYVGSVAIDHFGDLEVLDMSHNRLTRLHGKMFQGYKHLKFLDLSVNRLVEIERDTFGDMMNLQELRLERNKLRVISDFAFHSDAQLSTLMLNGNQFAAIPYLPMRSLKALKKVDVSYNPMVKLYRTDEPTTVEELKLDHLENLTNVEEEAFSAFQKLQSLSLRFARGLTDIPAAAFRGNFSSLRQVLLDHNGLTTLHQDLLPWQQLTVLTLHDNHWHCDCTLGWATGNSFIGTTIKCEDPYKLRGQILNTLKPEELACPKSLVGVKVIIGLALIAVAMTVMALILWQRRRRMPCWCLRGARGQYVTVFTRERETSVGVDREEGEGQGEGEGDTEDLDLGNGSSVRPEGRVQIMLQTFKSGYRRVMTKESESTQDLTLASQL